jgi:protoporphyrinogen oxidase
MKIAVLGGGFTGLTSAYYLAKKGHRVTLFEKEKILGGLAAGFKQKNWDWYLERAYHHLFANDDEIFNFAEEVGFKKIFFREEETASLYKISNFQFPISKQASNYQLPITNYRIFPVDTPQDFLKFPLLSLSEKLRAGLALAFLKLSPFFSFYEKQTAEEFLKKTMGGNVWNVLWQELFRKKFGKYAENILASFIWARINKRTKKLGYVKGGFQNFIDYIAERDIQLGVIVQKDCQVDTIEQKGNQFVLTYSRRPSQIGKEMFDIVISTLPTPVLTKITHNLFPKAYIKSLQKLRYLHAINLILETEESFLEKTYWLNVCVKEFPFMVVVQHSNFIDKQYYGGNHITYISKYIDTEDPLAKMNKEEVLKYWLPQMVKISNFHQPAGGPISQQTSNYQLPITNYFLFKEPFAQPIFDRQFLKNKPDFITPVKNLYIANLDMTYPYDRGTNFAVKLGKQVAQMI